VANQARKECIYSDFADFSFRYLVSRSQRVYVRGVDDQRRIVVLVSGNGSNLQAILDATESGDIQGEVVGVISNKADAYGLQRAANHSVRSICVAAESGEGRSAYDRRLADAVLDFAPNLIVLAGWMRLLSAQFLGQFPGIVINLHPALPGDLPGTRSIERAWQEALAGERVESGVMVHFVPDEGVDDGPVIASMRVIIRPDDTFESFETRIHDAEHELLTSAIGTLCQQRDQETAHA
jgi:phosphoribosylglycinamide formyltransferase-1